MEQSVCSAYGEAELRNNNKIPRELTEAKNTGKRQKANRRFLALYHQVVINDAASPAVGSCQVSGLSACSASSAQGHDMWSSGCLNSTSSRLVKPSLSPAYLQTVLYGDASVHHGIFSPRHGGRLCNLSVTGEVSLLTDCDALLGSQLDRCVQSVHGHNTTVAAL